MIYSDFSGIKLSKLGFGTMRLPLCEDKSIDEEQVQKMIDMAMENGVNYFDTAYPYHGGKSEIVVGKALKKYPRESYYLATKYPGHQISDSYDPAAVFEEQLSKCNVEYFDFYLLHNVCENSIGVYTDPQWSIIDYFIEQRKLGKIKHLGFSSHGRPDNLEYFLSKYAQEMEFCQIQLNYLDWTLQAGREKCEILKKYNIPVWVMEPVHGGKLAVLDDEITETLRSLRPDESCAAWAFRWLMGIDGVTVILSGMSNTEQMKDNIRTFNSDKPLSAKENELLAQIAEKLKDALPCTSCRYCCDGCPMELDIPTLISAYNDARFDKSFTVSMHLDSLPKDKLPTACIGCGACAQICPQKIDIPKAMKDFSILMDALPDWAAICRQRALEAKQNK